MPYKKHIYGGNAPSMDYYRSLGRNKALAELAEKRQKEQEKEQEDNALRILTDEILGRNNASLDIGLPTAKKEKSPSLLSDLFLGTKATAKSLAKSIGQGQATFSKNLAKELAKEQEKRVTPLDTKTKKIASSIGKLSNTASDIVADSKKESDLSLLQRTTRRTGKFIDSVIPFTNPIEDGLVRDFKNWNWLQETFGETDNKYDQAMDAVASILGNFIPGAASYKMAERAIDATRGVNKLARGAVKKGQTTGGKVLDEAQKGALSGALWGTQHEVGEQMGGRRESLMESLRNIGIDTIVGTAIDPAIMGMLGGFRSTAAPLARLARTQEPQLALPEPQLTLPDPRIHQYQQAIKEIDDNLAKRTKEYAEEIKELQKTHLKEVDTKLTNVLTEYNQAKKNFETTPINWKQISEGEAEWNIVKQLRQDYKNARSKENTFYIPKHVKADFADVPIPRSFIRKKENASMDIFSAAEAHGFRGDHQGAVEFGNYLRYLQQNNSIKKKDLIPEAIYPNNTKFKDTEGGASLEKQIKELVEERKAIEDASNFDFKSTDEFNAIMQTRNVYEQELNQLLKQSEIPKNETIKTLDDFEELLETINKRIDDLDDSFKVEDMPEYKPQSRIMDGGNVNARKVDSNLSKFDKIVTKSTDDIHGIKATLEKAKSDTLKMYEDARVSRGAQGAAEQYINDNLTKTLSNFRGNRKQFQQATDYLVNKHLLDIKRKPGFENYIAPGGRTTAYLEKQVKKLENNAEVKKLEKGIRAYTDGILDFLVQEGVLSKDVRNILKKEYPNYVPLYRQKGTAKKDDNQLDEIFDYYSRLNAGNVRKVVQELSEHGSEDQVKDVIANLAQYGMNAYQAGFSNRAMRNLRNVEGLSIDGKPLVVKVTPKNKHMFDKNNLVSFFENGKTVEYYVNNDLKGAFENLKGVMQFDELLNAAEKITKIMRLSITGNPFFSAKQFPRDTLQAWVDGKINFLQDIPIAFLDSMTKGKILGEKSYYRKYVEHGGGMDSLISYDKNSYVDLQRQIKRNNDNAGIVEITKDNIVYTFKKMLEQIHNFNLGLEQTAKVARFKRVYKETGDYAKAAYEGRDIMDYSRSGELTRSLNRYVGFLNTNIQGKSKQVRSLKERPIQTMGKIVVAGLLPSYLAKVYTDNFASENQLAMINELTEQQRQTYWWFPHLDDENKLISIPKPYEVAVLSSTPLEFFLNNEDKVGTDVSDFLKEWASQAFWVDPGLNITQPIQDVVYNKDSFTGREIDPQREEGLPASERQDVYTASTAKGLANLANYIPGVDVSPRTVQHLTEGYFPVAGEVVNELIDRTGEIAGLRENEKPKGITGLENLNPFVKDISQRSASTLIGQAHQSTRDLQGLKRVTQGYGEQFPFHNAYGANRMISDRDSDIAETIRMIDNDPTLSREEKRDLRQQYISERNENVRNAQRLGLFNTDENNLARLEERYEGLGRKENKDDIFKQASAQLVKSGVPEYQVKEVIKQAKEAELDNSQIAKLLMDLYNYYQ